MQYTCQYVVKKLFAGANDLALKVGTAHIQSNQISWRAKDEVPLPRLKLLVVNGQLDVETVFDDYYEDIFEYRMVKVEGGTFTMGNNSATSSSPAHQVTLSTYYIGQTEVTQQLWECVMGTNPSGFTGDLKKPVENVSWNDCQTFISRLNEMYGTDFRLPTEAEWEFAARGGIYSQGYSYSGSNYAYDVGWYGANSDNQSHRVATMAPNELGIYDMSGNVYEWCQDRYGSYSSSSQTNPTGPSSGSYRVIRGGGWKGVVGHCSVSYRFGQSPTSKENFRGFRLAR